MAHRTTKLIPAKVNPIGHPIIELASVDSTNNYAMAKVHAAGAAHGTVYFAHDQTSGKGQRGRSWSSAAGKNIMMTAIVQPHSHKPSDQFFLSMAMAWACHEFLGRYIPNDLTIKWPNDIYWQEKKLGGILIENIVKGRNWTCAVAGIGININQTSFDEALRNPVSLKQICGRDFEIMDLARELCRCMDEKYTLLRDGRQELIHAAYNGHLFKRNQLVSLRRAGETIKTTIKEVSREGRLISSKPNAGVFEFGEVDLLL